MPCTDYKIVAKYLSYNVITVHTDPIGCELNFTVLVEEGATTEGLELALFKKAETDTGSHVAYFVYIVYRKLGERFHSAVPAQRYILSSCKSWQVFDVSGIKDNLPVGVHKFNLLVAVFKETEINQQDPPIMSCNDVKSLFIMDTSADIKKFKGTEATSESETPTAVGEVEVDEKGEEKSTKDNDDTIEDETVEMASGSGGGEDLAVTMTSTPPPIVEEDKVENFLPTLAVFVSGGPNPLLIKRSTIESNKTDIDFESNKTDIDFNKGAADTVPGEEEEQVDVSDESSGANCRLLENKIDLPALDPDILKPTIVDIGKCSNSTDTVECRPTKFRTLEVLRKRTGEIEVASIEIRHNYIITECTPFAKTQLSTDDLTSSGSNPLRRRRSINETPKAEDYEMSKGKNEIIKTDVVTAIESDKKDSETSSGASCRLLENKIWLSTINPNIIVPEIWDFGRCSGSTNIMECRATGFQHLQVLLKTNGTISFNTLQNSITTECTPYFNTPTA